MSIAEPLPAGLRTSRRRGVLARCDVGADGSTITVLDGNRSGLEVHLAHHADHAAGRRLIGTFRRIAWARLELAPDGPRGEVHGLRHRLPVTVDVPVGTVLALASAGVPTVVVATEEPA
jgi:hypothetical protein